MKISIVTISYNQAKFLERAIRSIVEQEHNNLEYIIVDPGSTDGSRKIIERYHSKIAKMVYEGDAGPADGLNKGFAHATGEILGFINADDALLPGALRKVSDYFDSHPEIDVVCGSGFLIDAEDRIIRKMMPTRFSTRLYAYGAVTFLQQSTFFRKDAFLDVGGFNKDNRTCWDGELLSDMLVHQRKCGILHEDLALFRLHESSISGSGRLNEAYMKDRNRIFAKVTGREKNALDRLRMPIYRVEKWIMNPRVTLSRILSRFGFI